jgi:hypothetical protein
MNTPEQIWIIKNKIEDIRSSIACDDSIDYQRKYTEIHELEKQLSFLEKDSKPE